MKKISTITLLSVAVLLAAFPAFGAMLKTGEEYTLNKNDATVENLYIGAGNISVAGNVRRDLVAGGGNIIVTGNVTEDILLVGGDIGVYGQTGQDLRVLGGQIIVGNNVGQELVGAGGSIHVLSGVTIDGDTMLAGGTVILEGTVNQNVHIFAGEVKINGSILGNVYVVTDELTIGKNASITGNLIYSAEEEATILEGATILGETHFTKKDIGGRKAGAGFLGFIGFVSLLKLAIVLTAGLVAVFFCQKTSKALVEQSLSNIWIETARGFVILVVIPFAALFLLISMLGALIGLAVILMYIFLLIGASVYAGIIFGGWLYKYIWKDKTIEVNWKTAFLGIVLLHLIGLVPLVGWVIKLLLMLTALGSISIYIYRKALTLG